MAEAPKHMGQEVDESAHEEISDPTVCCPRCYGTGTMTMGDTCTACCGTGSYMDSGETRVPWCPV